MGRRASCARLMACFAVTLFILALPGAAHATHRLPNNGHWDRTSSVAHVKFLDYTGPAWPVGSAHADWDLAYNIDVDWETQDANSTCGPDCVRVRTRAASEDQLFGPNCTGAYGYWTNFAPDAQNHWRPGNEVRFNSSCNGEPYNDRRAVACQELGHGLGLDHSTSTDSCMYRFGNVAATTPREHDYNMLNLFIYDH